MLFLTKPNRHAWLWWVSIVALSIGVAVYILLQPAGYDAEIQRYRMMALVISVLISGLCVIVGTSKRWFGKDL
jgi:hypothetical protein